MRSSALPTFAAALDACATHNWRTLPSHLRRSRRRPSDAPCQIMISYLLPTRDRHDRLQQTLAALARLDPHAHAEIGGAELIIVDNASKDPVAAPRWLSNGIEVRVLRRE